LEHCAIKAGPVSSLPTGKSRPPSLNLEFEHHEKKIEQIGPRSKVMIAGDALLGAQVVEKARGTIAALPNPSTQQVADVLRDTYMTVHLERAEQVILFPRGLTFKEFKEHGATQIPLQVYLTIDNTLFTFGLGVVEFLVAGADATGAHLFRVHYNGLSGGSWQEWCDKLGYSAIGTGAPHASILLAIEGQHRGRSIAETLYNVYCAKRTSEVAPGVGSATDLAIITAEKIEILKEDRLKKLAALRDKHQHQKVTKEEMEAL